MVIQVDACLMQSYTNKPDMEVIVWIVPLIEMGQIAKSAAPITTWEKMDIVYHANVMKLGPFFSNVTRKENADVNRG